MKKLKLGVVGLGRAFALTAPTLARDSRIQMVAAADPREEARSRFTQEFGGESFPSLEALLRKSSAEAVYIATPHQLHAEQACLAAAAGKHVLVEKPMALSLDECRAMADAARGNAVSLVVGPSHSFDLPVKKTKQLIEGGSYGRVRMITALNFTDFLYRPRRPEELDTSRGGGAVHNQAAHHVDIARYLAQSPAKSVRAHTGAWDAARPTEGAYSAHISFEDGAFATLVYSGYAHFDSDEFTGWIGELGGKKSPASYGSSRKNLSGGNEATLKAARNYGGADFKIGRAQFHEHFGPLIVSCDKADLRPLPTGVMIHADGEQRLEAMPSAVETRAAVVDELYDSIMTGKPALHDAAWGLATTEACLAILESARSGREVPLRHQTSAWRI
jgi:phthalate 4,5-cis-dihydrodiol dehydrogenase